MSGTSDEDRKRLGWWLAGWLICGLLVGQTAILSLPAWGLNLDQEIQAQDAQSNAIVKTLDRSKAQEGSQKDSHMTVAAADEDGGMTVVLVPVHLRPHGDSATK